MISTTIIIPVKASTRPCNYWIVLLFSLVTLGTVIGVPIYAYFFDYSWVDWAMFGFLYAVTAMGITVG
ncbi:MAG: hypothetical protein AABY69_02845, partial [Nitrospirota bacterium]